MSDDGSEDSPPRPKRKIKRVVVMSSNSSSDSDESVAPTGTRRKRMRVVSDAESDSSGSSVVCAGTRRKKTLPKLRDSEGDSDTSGWDTDRSDTAKPTPAPAKPASGFASDSSEGNSDKCSICLMRFTTQEVGTPQNCEHIFCLDCITEWSKNVNTCPVDRITFESIVVRACAGGRVLRTEQVKVVERRPSVEMLVVEDPTVCEICGSSENEESMLLCDGCDLGFHMQCLTPPLTEIPADQWLCPNCDNILDVIHLSEVEDLFSGLVDIDLPLHPRPTALREPRNVRRSSRNISLDEPSTSSGRRGGSTANADAAPSTSRGTRTGRRNSTTGATGAGTTRRRTAGPQRRKYKRRRSKRVIIEYEVEENGKFPITKTVKRRVTKRRTKRRQPRTAARRSHVRASVRAMLDSLSVERSAAARTESLAGCGGGVQALSASRRRAGVPALSLFGRRDQLDYFAGDDDDERGVSEGAATAVAARPTPSVLSAYRQARRKMVTIPSPPHASSAPDLLSSILDSQAKLHSKHSVVSISVDGSVNIKVQTREDKSLNKVLSSTDKKLDLSKGGEESTRQAPSYPGQSRGGWGGGYRGGREAGRGGGGYHSDGQQAGYGYQNRGPQGAPHNSFGNVRRDDADGYGNFARRQYPYPQSDDHFDRNRRPQPDGNRPPNFPHNRHDDRQGRHSLGPSWQPYGARRDGPPTRHSFGSENPLDMRVGQIPQSAPNARPTTEAFSRMETDDGPQPYRPLRPLPEPPMFKFDKTPEVEKSEDEKSDSGLVIDTEKYDPTEPTNDDDDSGDEAAGVASSGTPDVAAVSPSVASVPAVEPPPPPSQAVVQNIIAGIDAGALNVPANVLDSAVRQVLQEHRALMTPSAPGPARDRSDDDSDGDCPNFSIYSATSVHIANDSAPAREAPPALAADDMADLVQEDDDTPPPELASPIADVARPPVVTPPPIKTYGYDADVKRKTDEELKEKVSKRCPITTNPRNPIKIKLNTPSLIKRHVALYDDEPADEADAADRADPSEESPKKNVYDKGSSENIGENATDNSKLQIETPENLKPDEEKEISKDVEKTMESPKKRQSVDEPADEPTEVPESAITSVGKDEDDKNEERSPKVAIAEEASDEEKVLEDEEKELGKRDDDDDSVSDKDEAHSDDADANDDISDGELPLHRDSDGRNDDALEKMTESISETEDERSYTPCLDENKSKDTSLEAEKEKGIEGLDTEMISEDEGNEMFSDDEPRSRKSRSRSPSPSPSPSHSPAPAPARAAVAPEDGEILDKRKDKPERDDGPKKKKRKDSKRDSKKDGKEKSKKSKRSDVTFKKLSKSGRERNYRDRDKDKDREDRPRRDSSAERKRKRKEKRKDLERYDVRTVVTEKRRRAKDPFGRDVSPRRSRSPSPERSPPAASPSPGPPRARRRSASRPRRSPSSARLRRSPTPARLRRSPSTSRPRRSPSPSRLRRSPSPIRLRRSPSPLRARRSPSPVRRRRTKSPSRARRTPSPIRRSPSLGRSRRSATPRGSSPVRRRVSSSPMRRVRASASPPSPSPRRRRRSTSRARRRRSASRARKRRASGSASGERAAKGKRRRRARSERPRRRSPKRRRRRRSAAREAPAPLPQAPEGWSPVWGTPGGSVDSRLLSPRTPPPEPAPPAPPAPAPAPRTPRRRHERARRRRALSTAAASKEVFTSGDNILVSVSFKDRTGGEESPSRRSRREKRRSRRRRKPGADDAAARPVAIIDLERSPFRELTPSPRNVIVLSDSDHGGNESAPKEKAVAEPAPAAAGPRTPPERDVAADCEDAAHPPDKGHRAAPATATEPAAGPGAGPAAGAEAGSARSGPGSPDAYDPFEPTRSPSASPPPPPPRVAQATPPRTMTLEAAQKTNMSADDVIDRRPLSPMEKVMALLQSTRDVSPEPPPPDTVNPPAAASPPLAVSVPGAPAGAPAPRIVLPEAPRAAPPKLFLAKPSPIKSDPIKPMQVRDIARPVRRAESDLGGDSPYSPGSSDFGELFEPPAPAPRRRERAAAAAAAAAAADPFDALVLQPRRRGNKSAAAKVPVKLNKKKGKTQVGVKIDEDNLKILDDLPSSAVEMQVKSKVRYPSFLKKLNRQERVVEEVKLVLKPHYNKKRVTKDEYKDILRRAVPKICHNKSGEINPTKIQALVEAYVKKFRKKHKLGLA